MIVSITVSNFVKNLSGINNFTLTYLWGAANFGTRCITADAWCRAVDGELFALSPLVFSFTQAVLLQLTAFLALYAIRYIA